MVLTILYNCNIIMLTCNEITEYLKIFVKITMYIIKLKIILKCMVKNYKV